VEEYEMALMALAAANGSVRWVWD